MSERGVARRPRLGLETLASATFLVYVAVLPWSIAPMSVALGLCGATTLASWVWRRPSWTPPRPLLLPALAWILALLVAACFAADRAASLPRVAKGALVAVAWLAAYHARESGAGYRAVRVLLISAALAALFGLSLWIGRGALFPERARGLVGHYMTFAGQLLFWISIAAGIALVKSPRAWRLGAVGTALVCGLALAATYTRSAWIGAGVSLAAMLALWRPKGLALLAAVVAVTVLVAPPSFRERLASAFDPGHASNLERRHMWEAGVRMFLDHPITGVGLQDLHADYERYRSPVAREPAGHLHNVFVQIAATMGLVGLAAFAWLYLALFRTAAARPRGAAGGQGVAEGLRLGMAGALTGFVVAGLFEWNFGDEELLHALFALVGIAWSARHWREEQASGVEAR